MVASYSGSSAAEAAFEPGCMKSGTSPVEQAPHGLIRCECVPKRRRTRAGKRGSARSRLPPGKQSRQATEQARLFRMGAFTGFPGGHHHLPRRPAVDSCGRFIRIALARRATLATWRAIALGCRSRAGVGFDAGGAFATAVAAATTTARLTRRFGSAAFGGCGSFGLVHDHGNRPFAGCDDIACGGCRGRPPLTRRTLAA